jgi:hypothetical protein
MTHSDPENYTAHLWDRQFCKKDYDYFHANPWSRKWLDDAQYTAVKMTTRVPKPTRAEDYFARTLNTPSTISHWLDLASTALIDPNTIDQTTPGPDRPDVVLFVSLERGISGFRDTTHGGVLCALLDEVQSTCVELRRLAQSPDTVNLYTASLNIDFRRPVPTPGLAMVKAWLESRQGRKWRARGVILDFEGRTCAEATSLWIAARKEKI